MEELEIVDVAKEQTANIIEEEIDQIVHLREQATISLMYFSQDSNHDIIESILDLFQDMKYKFGDKIKLIDRPIILLNNEYKSVQSLKFINEKSVFDYIDKHSEVYLYSLLKIPMYDSYTIRAVVVEL